MADENNKGFSFFFVGIVAVILIAAVLKGFIPREADTVNDSADNIRLLLGSYTTLPPRNDKDSRGIYSVNYDTATHEFSSPVLIANAINPSIATRSRDGIFYIAFETEKGTVNVFDWDETLEKLKPLNSVPSMGKSPCYLALSPNERFLAVANYMSGSVTVFEIDEETRGLKFNSAQTVENSGSGPNKDRQEAAHAHWVQWNSSGDKLYVVDLGIDKVMVYDFDKNTGSLGQGQIAFSTEPGAGPRHMAFHPSLPAAYLLNELSNTLTQLKIEESGKLTAVKTISTLPEGFGGHSQAAHIVISKDGKTLYSSNRGHNSIAVVNLAENGDMNLIQLSPSAGNWPRYFLVLEEHNAVIVAHELSHNLSVFSINEDGTLENTGKGAFAPSPTYLGLLTNL